MLVNEAVQSVYVINNDILPKAIPIKLALRLNNILAVLAPKVDTFYSARKALIEKFGVLQGTEYTFTPEAEVEVNKEIDKLLATEIEALPDNLKISLNEIGSVEIPGARALHLRAILKD